MEIRPPSCDLSSEPGGPTESSMAVIDATSIPPLPPPSDGDGVGGGAAEVEVEVVAAAAEGAGGGACGAGAGGTRSIICGVL